MNVAEAAKLALARLRKEEQAKLVPVGGLESRYSEDATNKHFEDSATDMEDIKQFARIALGKMRGTNV